VIAYKFLEPGRVAPFTRFAWPEGEWVEADAAHKCGRGVHACRADQLPFWLGRELWEIELGGEIVEHARKVVASRGRLVRRVEGWTTELLDAFVADLVRRTRSRFGAVAGAGAYLEDIQRFQPQRRYGLAAFAAARAAEIAGGPRAYDAERARQARWLAEQLCL
jgi:hypothetical protein